MKFMKNDIWMIIILVFTIIFVQLIRMDIFIRPDPSRYEIDNEYIHADSIKLSEDEKEQFSDKYYLILYESSNDNDLENIIVLSDYLKIDYEIANAAEKEIDYSRYETIILLESGESQDINLSALFDYVENGGNLLYLGNGSKGDEDLLKLYPDYLGISNWNTIKETNTVYFNTEILIGLTGYFDLDANDIEEYNNFRYLDVEVHKGTKVHMEELSGSPLIWERDFGKGKIMVLNIGRYNSRETRGLIAGAFTLLEDLYIYPIINSEVIFIDDFPADYKSEHPLIKKHYGRSFERFVKEIWWPDMISLMKKYDLKYTAAYIQSYNDVVNGPFEYNKSTNLTTKELVRGLIKNEGEISFHGYNHQSLLFQQSSADLYGYNSWPSEEKVIESIRKARDNFNNLFPNYTFYTYVPPSNLLDEKAIPGLKKAIPTLKTISGLYFGEVDDSGEPLQDIMLQEIGISENGLVNLPRFTSESFMNDNLRYRIASTITLHGLINHFMHPDDILDPERSLGFLWKGLYKNTEEFFSTLDNVYPWIHKDTASTASEKVKQYHYSKIYYDEIDNQIQIACDNFGSEISLIVTTNKEIVSSSNCHYEKIGLNRYLVILYGSKAYLEVK